MGRAVRPAAPVAATGVPAFDPRKRGRTWDVTDLESVELAGMLYEDTLSVEYGIEVRPGLVDRLTEAWFTTGEPVPFEVVK